MENKIQTQSETPQNIETPKKEESIMDKVEAMARDLEEGWDKLSANGKKVLVAVTACGAAAGFCAAGGSALATYESVRYFQSVQAQQEEAAEINSYDKPGVERGYLNENQSEIEDMLANAKEISYFVLTRGGYVKVNAHIEGNMFYADPNDMQETQPESPGDWVKGLTASATHSLSNILAIETEDNQEVVVFAPYSNLEQYPLSEGITISDLAERIVSFDTHPDSSGALLSKIELK